MATTTDDKELTLRADRALREVEVKLAKDRLDTAIGRLASAAAYVAETTAEYVAAVEKARDAEG